MPGYTVNPLTDTRWLDLLYRHPSASVFHTPGCLAALQRTYGYEPMVVTTCPPTTELTNGIVLCRVKSLFTGSRLVSLPFSDHCEPLANSDGELHELLSSIACLRVSSRYRYIELRPLLVSPGTRNGFDASSKFFMHQLLLSSDAAELFCQFSKASIQRKIRRAERERLRYEEGCSEGLLREFYRLLLMTRRRHRLPPQPLAWFRELVTCMGDNVKVRLAFKDCTAIAGIVTLQFKDVMTYKYGCSDADYHNLGGMPMLLWRAIQEAVGLGLYTFDFGRSDPDNGGLVIFKDRWGGARSVLTYWSTAMAPQASRRFWNHGWAGRALAQCPDPVLSLAGRLLYRHIG